MNWYTVAAYEDDLRKVDRKLGSLILTTSEEVLSRYDKPYYIIVTDMRSMELFYLIYNIRHTIDFFCIIKVVVRAFLQN